MACSRDFMLDVNRLCQQQKLKLVSYNMHGFSQGFPTAQDLIAQESPDISLIQEHWLTPPNMYKLQSMFGDYLILGSSAMSSSTETGILRGRPFGGVAIMIHNKLRQFTKLICAAERFVVVKISDCLFVNWYLPCSGTLNRHLIIGVNSHGDCCVH